MDELTLINAALAKCGLPLAAALNDCDWNASYFLESATKECLRSFAWGFAQKLEPLTASGVPKHGFEKSYPLPDDCLRVVDAHCMHDLRSPKVRNMRVSGKFIYSNTTPFYLRYISSDVPISDWPPDFFDAVACNLATKIAPLSTQTMALTPQLVQLYNVALANAQATDARENFERVPHDWNIMAARGGAGEGRGK